LKYPEVTIASLEHPDKGSYKIGPFGSSLKKDELVDKGIPVVGIENILPNEFVRTYRKFITDEKYQQLERYSVQTGDVLVTTMGTVGRAAVVPEGVGTMIYDSHLFRMRTDPQKIVPEYLTYALNNYEGLTRQIAQRARGAIMAGLNTTILKECTIPLPPLTEQQRIAAILDKADALRAKRRTAVGKLDTLLQSTFLHMFCDPVTNPMGWRLRSIESLCELVRGSSPRPKGDPRYYGGPVPRLMVADLTRDGFFVTPKIDNLTEEGAKKSRYTTSGTVVMAVSGNVGLTAILKIDACVHDGFVAFNNLKEPVITTRYFMYCLHLLKQTHETRKDGAIFQNVTTTAIKAMKIPVPPLELQNKWEDSFDKYLKIEQAHQTGVNMLDTFFHSLQQRAFKGEL
jgi:type I restriction enzyme, S subunit